MQKILSILLFSVFALQINAQCPFEKGDCRGECRRFVDKNGDGFCDLGFVTETLSIVEPDLYGPSEPEKQTSRLEQIDPDERMAEDLVGIGGYELAIDVSDSPVLVSDTTLAEPEVLGEPEMLEEEEFQNKQAPKKGYDLLLITLLTVGLYMLSVLFVKFKNINKVTHRKIWNVVLLVSFLVSGILGLVLIVQINYNIAMPLFLDFLVLHVEFGIVMAVVSIIHILLHLNYYLDMFVRK